MKQRVAQVFVHKSILVLIILGSVVRLSSSIEEDTISGGVVIKDPETIVSQKQIYKLGFFTPPNTTNRYVGVFFAFSEETVIWVANREKPLKDASGAVTLSQDGNLVVIDGANQTLWSTNLTTSSVNSTVQILDTGNLVVRDAATGDTLWQSFSEPTNVVVPGMTLSQNVKTGKQVAVSAWKNASDPEIGSFSAGLDALSIPQLFAWNEGRPHWRSGPWNGLIFLGIKEMFYAYLDGFTQVKNDSAGNFFYTKPQENVYITASVNSSGSVIRKVWNGIEKRWDLVWTAPENECDVYGKCGPFGSCNALQSPICTCLRGFEPVNEDEWRRGNWTNGCRRRNQLQCEKGDRFQRLQYMKVPDFAQPLPSRVQDECRTTCMANCSCLAYAYDLNIGCMFWSNILIDAQEFDRVGVDLYIRLSASEFDLATPIIPQNNQISVKLNENNFLIWKQQIMANVRGLGLEKYFIRDPPAATKAGEDGEMLPNSEYISWVRQDQLLSAWIQSSLTESTMILVVGLTTSKEIWEALLQNYSNQSKAKVMQYKLQLQTLKKEALSMRDYLNKIKTCCDLLGSAGYRVSDDDQIMHTLAGLGPEYDSVMVTITSKPEVWTLGDVSSLLLSFESRIEAAKAQVINTEGSQPSANLVQSAHQGNNQGGRGKSFQNNTNSSRGGFSGGFGGRGRNGGRGGRNGGRYGNNKPICQVCGITGHTADRCWHRFEPNFVPGSRNNSMRPSSSAQGTMQPNFSHSNFSQQPSLNMAQLPPASTTSESWFDNSSPSTWYPDSGATNHVSHDYNAFHNVSDYHGGPGNQSNSSQGHP